MTLPTEDKTVSSTTPDSYDPHIIPAETAARKDREGDQYKQLPKNSEGPGSIDTTGGYTMDQEGLANNYGVEPEMYVETPGDIQNRSESPSLSDKYTIVDMFGSLTEAEAIVTKMKKAGLDTHKISILGKNYQDTNLKHGTLSFKELSEAQGIAVFLTGLGITSTEAIRYETEINMGKFLVIVIGSDREISQANKVLHQIGHKTIEEVTA